MPTAHLPTFQGGTPPVHRRALTFILSMYYGPLSQSWDSPPSDAGQVVHLCLEPSRMLSLPVVLALFDRWEDDAPLDLLLRRDETCGGRVVEKQNAGQKNDISSSNCSSTGWARPQQNDETTTKRKAETHSGVRDGQNRRGTACVWYPLVIQTHTIHRDSVLVVCRSRLKLYASLLCDQDRIIHATNNDSKQVG